MEQKKMRQRCRDCKYHSWWVQCSRVFGKLGDNEICFKLKWWKIWRRKIRIPYPKFNFKIIVTTEKRLDKKAEVIAREKINAAVRGAQKNDTKIQHNMMIERAKLLFERQQLIKAINELRKINDELRTRAPGKPVKKKPVPKAQEDNKN